MSQLAIKRLKIAILYNRPPYILLELLSNVESAIAADNAAGLSQFARTFPPKTTFGSGVPPIGFSDKSSFGGHSIGFGGVPSTGGFGSRPSTGGFGGGPSIGGFGGVPSAGGFGSGPSTGGFGGDKSTITEFSKITK